MWALTGRPVLSETGEVIGFRGFGSDLSEKTRAEAELRRAARYDSLTGLPNRATILKCLEDALRVASRTECALLIVDLDRFKEVNDTLGHLVGDDVLRQAATRIEQIFGKHGTVGRLGGDEFEVVISVNTRRETVEELARRCIVYLSQAFKAGERSISIGASVGIAYAFPQSEDAESLFRKADLALYAAKTERGMSRVFEPEMEMISANRQALEHDLRLAMAAGDLEVFFQPVVAGTSENLAGFEALVRWDHIEQGFISPQSFIQIAEDTGLINQLGEWVLEDRLPGSGEMAREPVHRGQRLADAVRQQGLLLAGPAGARQCRPAGRPAGARDHRSGLPRRRPEDRRDLRLAEEDRRAGWPWTISEPAIPASPIWSGRRSTRSRSTGPSSKAPRCPEAATSRSSRRSSAWRTSSRCRPRRKGRRPIRSWT